MSFSFLGSLAGLLPGYLNGQRMAVKDNWQDLMNYNQAQQGQLSNMFTEATWQPRIDMFTDNALRNRMNMWGDMMDFGTKWYAWPGQLGNAQVYSAMDPMANYWSYLNAFRQQQGMGGQFAQTPSNIGG